MGYSVGNFWHKNLVSGEFWCRHPQAKNPKFINILTYRRHFANMLPTFPAKFDVEISKKQILLQPNTLRSPEPPSNAPVGTTLTLDHWDERWRMGTLFPNTCCPLPCNRVLKRTAKKGNANVATLALSTINAAASLVTTTKASSLLNPLGPRLPPTLSC